MRNLPTQREEERGAEGFFARIERGERLKRGKKLKSSKAQKLKSSKEGESSKAQESKGLSRSWGSKEGEKFRRKKGKRQELVLVAPRPPRSTQRSVSKNTPHLGNLLYSKLFYVRSKTFTHYGKAKVCSALLVFSFQSGLFIAKPFFVRAIVWDGSRCFQLLREGWKDRWTNRCHLRGIVV